MTAETPGNSLVVAQPGAVTGRTVPEELLFEGYPAVLPSIGAWILAILTVGLAAIYFFVRSRQVHYKVTTQRVLLENGIFSKRMEQLDLYRITDYVVDRPMMQRMVGTGNITLETVDKTTREVVLRGLPTDVVKLYERLRAATEAEKARRGVKLVDYET
jgi:uncharacterized membrane protein YdbT with pleckstrin-like domain